MGYAVGSYGAFSSIILKTTNGGVNWIPQTSGISYSLYSVFFTDNNTGYAIEEGGSFIKSTNGGTQWDTQSSGTFNELYSVNFPDFNTGYVVGNGPSHIIILKTTNGGNWIEESSLTKMEFSVYPNPAADQITINLQDIQNLSNSILSVYNIQGQMLLQQSIHEQQTEINISQLPQGIYFTKIRLTDGAVVEKKFVVVR